MKRGLLFTILVCLTFVGGDVLGQTIVHQATLTGGNVIPNKKEYAYIKKPTFGVEWTTLWFQEDPLGVRKPYWFGVRGSYTHIVDGIAGDRYALDGVLQNLLCGSIYGANLRYELAAGFSAYPRPYSRTQDTLNEMIGSYLNCFIELGFLGFLPLNERCDGVLGLKFVHSSNGYIKKPNQGLNYAQATLGLQLHPSRVDELFLDTLKIDSPFVPASAFFVSYASGLVQPRSGDESLKSYYYAYTASAGYNWRVGAHHLAGGYLDLMFNCSHRDMLPLKGDPMAVAKYPFYLAVCGNFDSYWDRLMLRLSIGAYLRTSSLNSWPIYERVGVYYHLTEHLYAGISLKSHAAHIDYVEFGVGANLRFKQ